MASYLEAFQARVRAAHRNPNVYCHWTKYDEVVGKTLIRRAKGPCNCPKHRADQNSCDPHGGIGCASTTDVLAVKVASLAHYTKPLDDLKTASDALDAAIASGQERYDKAIQIDNDTPSDALHNSYFNGFVTGYFGQNGKEYKAVRTIWKLALDTPPDLAGYDAGSECDCWVNKVARLSAEVSALSELFTQCSDLSSAVADAQKDLTATFSNTFLPVLTGSLKLVSGLFAGELDQVVSGARDLAAHLTKTASDNAKAWVLMKTAQALAAMKRDAMLGVIYHDQQLASPVCRDPGDDDENGGDGGGGQGGDGGGPDGGGGGEEGGGGGDEGDPGVLRECGKKFPLQSTGEGTTPKAAREDARAKGKALAARGCPQRCRKLVEVSFSGDPVPGGTKGYTCVGQGVYRCEREK